MEAALDDVKWDFLCEHMVAGAMSCRVSVVHILLCTPWKVSALQYVGCWVRLQAIVRGFQFNCREI